MTFVKTSLAFLDGQSDTQSCMDETSFRTLWCTSNGRFGWKQNSSGLWILTSISRITEKFSSTIISWLFIVIGLIMIPIQWNSRMTTSKSSKCYYMIQSLKIRGKMQGSLTNRRHSPTQNPLKANTVPYPIGSMYSIFNNVPVFVHDDLYG